MSFIILRARVGGCGAGPQSPGRGACCGRTAARARAPGLGREGVEESLCVRYTAPRRDSLIAPGPGPAPPSRPPSPPPPPPLPPPPPTTTAPPFWTRCVSCVRARGLAGRPRVRGADGVRESRPAQKPVHTGGRGSWRGRYVDGVGLGTAEDGEARRGAWAPPETPTVPDAARQRAEARPRSPAEPPSPIQGRAALMTGRLVCCPSPQTVNLSCQWGGACVCSSRSVGSCPDVCASCSHLCKKGKSCPGVTVRARPLPPACLSSNPRLQKKIKKEGRKKSTLLSRGSRKGETETVCTAHVRKS